MRTLDRVGRGRQFLRASALERGKPGDRQDAMTNGFVVATDPTTPPAGLERAVYAIGNFDGMHLGHQAVIARARALARERGVPSALLTFEPHPADYFAERPVAFRLTPAKMKARLCDSLGVLGHRHPLLQRRARLVDCGGVCRPLPRRRLAAGAVVVDGTFISARPGLGPRLSWRCRARYGFAVEIAAKVEDGGGEQARVVSSTAIRRASSEARSKPARRAARTSLFCVGFGHFRAAAWAPTLGVPTANIALDTTTRLAHGIYAVRARVEGKPIPGVASFGFWPTVDNGPPLLEVHLLGLPWRSLRGARWVPTSSSASGKSGSSICLRCSPRRDLQRDKERARAILATAP